MAYSADKAVTFDIDKVGKLLSIAEKLRDLPNLKSLLDSVNDELVEIACKETEVREKAAAEKAEKDAADAQKAAEEKAEADKKAKEEAKAEEEKANA